MNTLNKIASQLEKQALDPALMRALTYGGIGAGIGGLGGLAGSALRDHGRSEDDDQRSSYLRNALLGALLGGGVGGAAGYFTAAGRAPESMDFTSANPMASTSFRDQAAAAFPEAARHPSEPEFNPTQYPLGATNVPIG